MVPFIDLRRRVESIRPAMEARLARVFERGRFILGEAVEELEGAFSDHCGARHGVAVASGTDALWLTLEALGVGAGDEVITVSNTCVPTVAAIIRSGATPVLVDVDPGTLTIDPELVEASLTSRTRCILPVHLYGQCADMGPLRQLAESRGLFLVEDCAQAHGATYRGKPAGSLGHAGCFSFYPTKNLGGLGDGGMVVTDDPHLAHRLRRLRNYGYAEPNRSETKGYNSRLDELQAAIILAGLPRLAEWNERRRSVARTYGAALAETNVAPPVEAEYARHVYHLYVVRAHERERLRAQLSAMGVETLIHYPVPVHRQEGYAERCRVGKGGLERTERISSEIVSLPIFPELREEEVQTVIEGVAVSQVR
jgi:dTDP-4-amino-4,6-dideoxygalactose transaminase